ncbi:TVP38/TMEM64 family protein [Corynebacterium mastitidis]|uniref:TVP38/TMEM64 family protein n=1 Tax=Corynebacterium mastitidis TaxID=161890 RepID=UPI000382289E|nr:TVP38/TMEM64 family protein [Corynebacterium mastitidis]
MRDFLLLLVRDARATVSGWSRARRAAACAAALLFVLLTWRLEAPDLATLRHWAEHTAAWFPLLFWALYVGITQFPVPRTLLTLSAGLLFGPWWGAAVALSATTASAVLSLAIVRGALGEWMAPRLRHPGVARISARLEQRGWLAVGSLRLIAGIPFSLLNYAAALSPVRVLPFAAATAAGSAPGTIAVVALGDSLASGLDARMLAAMLLLAALGVAGLALDRRLPVKPLP